MIKVPTITNLKQLSGFVENNQVTYFTEYLGGGKSEVGEDGSIIGTGDEEADISGESGPSVAELLSSSLSKSTWFLLSKSTWVSGAAATSRLDSSIIATPPEQKIKIKTSWS